MGRKVANHHDLVVYQKAFSVAMEWFEVSKRLPREEIYSLTDQARRSSRSVCANITEAWRKRRYEAHFVSKLSDAETEAGETQTWLEFAVHCGYVPPDVAKPLYQSYNEVISMLVEMINHPEPWLLRPNAKRRRSDQR